MNGFAFRSVSHVKIKIERLLKPSENSLNSKSEETLKLIHKHVDSYEEISKITLNTDLDKLIHLLACDFEETVDDISENGVELPAEELEDLKEDENNSVTIVLKSEAQRLSDGLYNLIPDEEEDDGSDGGAPSPSKVIGMSDVYQQLIDKVLEMNVQFTSLVGMPGIGKTTLASKLFHDPEVVKCYNYCTWIHVGKKCQVKDIPRRILEEIDPDGLQALPEGDEEAVNEYLKACLKRDSYFIVLDDVWDRFATYLLHPCYRYRWNQLNHPFLHPESASHILLTSRLQQLNYLRKSFPPLDAVVTMRLLNKEESWDLFCDKVFSESSSCPPQLEKAGRKISENCDGLPLTILTVARLLSGEETATVEYWNEIAAKQNHQVFVDAYEEMSKVLLPSYTYLTRLLQMCFLFLGLFPRNLEVPRSKLINLWTADGYFELNVNINSYSDAIDCLEELASNNVVMVYKKSIYTLSHTVKTCGLHSSLWHLSRQKAREDKFALILSSLSDCFGEAIEGHPRLSFNNNVLFGIKGVNESMEDNCASVAHSLFCFGSYHQYQVPLCFRMKLLTELDALSIRFYEFPMEVLQLLRLKYLALTSNGMIPPSISQLSCLQFLILDRHQHIKSCRDQLYLPVEIWGLQDLKHLQVMGRDLPDPCGASLENLKKLLNVSARSCTEAVFKGIPYLDELKIRIELAPDGDGKPLNCFTHISYLSVLSKLKCDIVNPEVLPPVVPFSNFPAVYFTTLSLSGLAYPWEEMRKIASLPNLYVLKLKKYAFQGPDWEVEEGGFGKLYTLVIEDTDMVGWRFGCDAFTNLHSLTIKHCYKLKKIHGVFEQQRLLNIKVVDCNPACVEEMQKAIPEKSQHIVLDVHSSWVDVKLKK